MVYVDGVRHNHGRFMKCICLSKDSDEIKNSRKVWSEVVFRKHKFDHRCFGLTQKTSLHGKYVVRCKEEGLKKRKYSTFF